MNDNRSNKNMVFTLMTPFTHYLRNAASLSIEKTIKILDHQNTDAPVPHSIKYNHYHFKLP